MAKISSIQQGAVQILCDLLDDPAYQVRAASAAALMAITTVDAGKRAVIPAGGVPKLVELLQDPEFSVKLNVLKAIASITAHPEIREQLKHDDTCLASLVVVANGENELLARSAETAKRLVLWTP
jgi:HEAT repeat protein